MSGAVSDSIAMEGGLLFLSFLFGIGLMLLYDVLRILRHLRKHGTLLLAIEDSLYWFVCAIAIFAMLYEENNGLLRWFVLGGILVGMPMENLFISPWMVGLFVRILTIWLKVFKKIIQVVEKPGKKLFQIMRKELKKVRKGIKIGLSKE